MSKARSTGATRGKQQTTASEDVQITVEENQPRSKGKKRAIESDREQKPSQPRYLPLYADLDDSDLSDNLTQAPSTVLSDSFILPASADGSSATSTLTASTTESLLATIRLACRTPDLDEDDLFPLRYIKQTLSGRKRVAYVVFNGLSPGLFYNWQSCERSMADLPDFAKKYAGYKTYEEAHAAWDNYLSDGSLPSNISTITQEMFALADKLRDNIARQQAAQAAAIERLPPPFSPVSRKNASQPPNPSSAPLPPQRYGKQGLVAQPELPNPSYSSSSSHTESDHPDYWVVYAGFAPGVYSNRASAVAEGNDLNKGYVVVPTYNDATELFTDYFMRRRVCYLPRRPVTP